jgi:hypothetical protein
VDEYHNKTLIRLREYNPETDTDYIYITGEKSGCWSYVGRIGGVSYITTALVIHTDQYIKSKCHDTLDPKVHLYRFSKKSQNRVRTVRPCFVTSIVSILTSCCLNICSYLSHIVPLWNRNCWFSHFISLPILLFVTNHPHEAQSFLRSEQNVQLVKKFLAFYRTKCSLANSQEPTPSPCPEPDKSNPYPQILFSEDP